MKLPNLISILLVSIWFPRYIEGLYKKGSHVRTPYLELSTTPSNESVLDPSYSAKFFRSTTTSKKDVPQFSALEGKKTWKNQRSQGSRFSKQTKKASAKKMRDKLKKRGSRQYSEGFGLDETISGTSSFFGSILNNIFVILICCFSILASICCCLMRFVEKSLHNANRNNDFEMQEYRYADRRVAVF